MIRRLEVLGLALVSVIAIGAVSAPHASAEFGQFTADGNFTLTGSDELEVFNTQITYEAGEGNGIRCKNAHYKGEARFTGGYIQSGSSSATITPTYGECAFGFILPTKVTVNGCDCDLFIGGTVEAASYEAAIDFTCPFTEGTQNKIEFHIYLSKEAEAADEAFCTMSIEEQFHRTGATLSGSENGDLTLGGAAEEVEMTREGPCGEGSSSSGEIRFAMTLLGVNEIEEETEVSLSD